MALHLTIAGGRALRALPLALAGECLYVGRTGKVTPENLLRAISQRSRGRSSVASPVVLSESERALGFTLPSFYVRVLTEVANGGFGPGGGVIGHGRAGFVDPETGLDAVQRYLDCRNDEPPWQLPRGLLPLCSWGPGTMSYLDCLSLSDRVLTDQVMPDHVQFTETSRTLADFFTSWLDGFDFSSALTTVLREVDYTNPFTRRADRFPICSRIGPIVDLSER